MDALRARWLAILRTLRAEAWLPGATAAAQWALVGCAAIATLAQTVGYLGRVTGPGRNAHDLGWFAAWAELVGFAAFTANLLATPLTWWLIWALFRRSGSDLQAGPRRRRAVWRRIWFLVLGILAPPLTGAVLRSERALAVPPVWTLAEVPLSALALWALGAYLLLGYWMRRMCFRVGLAGLALYVIDRTFGILPGWMTQWPSAGGTLGLSQAEAGYLESFTGITMTFGFVVLGSMMLAGRPLMAPGPVVLAPPPMPPLPGPTTPTPQPEPPRDVELPRHPSGRVIRRMDV